MRCRRAAALAVLGLEQGFETPTLAVIGEQDILGDRLVRPRRKAKRAADVLTEATSLSVGDLVVHADHGIGRFAGLKTIEALGPRTIAWSCTTPAATSCSCRSRTSSCCRATAPTRPTAQLDRLGGVAWQSRKAQLKKRLREIAGELIKIAALRQLREAAR